MRRLLSAGGAVAVACIIAWSFSAPAARPAAEATGAVEGTVRVTAGRRAENSVVYLKGVPPGGSSSASAGAAAAAELPPAVMDQRGNTFIPHILAVRRRQRVRFGNQDAFMHNVHIYWSGRSMYNHTQEPERWSEWTPARAGEYTLLCDIHPEMLAFVLVFDHPFFADAGPGSGAGEFRIAGIPPGDYTLVVARSVARELRTREHPVRIVPGETNVLDLTF